MDRITSVNGPMDENDLAPNAHIPAVPKLSMFEARKYGIIGDDGLRTPLPRIDLNLKEAPKAGRPSTRARLLSGPVFKGNKPHMLTEAQNAAVKKYFSRLSAEDHEDGVNVEEFVATEASTLKSDMEQREVKKQLTELHSLIDSVKSHDYKEKLPAVPTMSESESKEKAEQELEKKKMKALATKRLEEQEKGPSVRTVRKLVQEQIRKLRMNPTEFQKFEQRVDLMQSRKRLQSTPQRDVVDSNIKNVSAQTTENKLMHIQQRKVEHEAKATQAKQKQKVKAYEKVAKKLADAQYRLERNEWPGPRPSPHIIKNFSYVEKWQMLTALLGRQSLIERKLEEIRHERTEHEKEMRAAMTIQVFWNKFHGLLKKKRTSASKELLNRHFLRLLIKRRVKQQYEAADVVRAWLHDLSKSSRMAKAIKTFRFKIILVQRMWRRHRLITDATIECLLRQVNDTEFRKVRLDMFGVPMEAAVVTLGTLEMEASMAAMSSPRTAHGRPMESPRRRGNRAAGGRRTRTGTGLAKPKKRPKKQSHVLTLEQTREIYKKLMPDFEKRPMITKMLLIRRHEWCANRVAPPSEESVSVEEMSKFLWEHRLRTILTDEERLTWLAVCQMSNNTGKSTSTLLKNANDNGKGIYEVKEETVEEANG